MQLSITSKTRITGIPENTPAAHAARHLERDIKALCLPGDAPGVSIELRKDKALSDEGYTLRAEDGALCLRAGGELGFVYGLYAISRTILGVHDLWFWNDQPFTPKASYPVAPDLLMESPAYAVKLRGWFINDEVLLHTWRPGGSSTLPWEMAFEALLRLGGNMVIPGTGQNAHQYRRLASDMGLYITHHHAEPLGAPMFSTRYPELTASYAEHPEQFEALWQEGIDSQKQDKIVWNLGFRGQGDRPFWDDDPQYTTPEARGRLIGELIEKQYRMVQTACPGAPCCTNLYGEVLELYRQGHIVLPKGVIRVWADNGYGKMVSRRQGNHNPRLQSLPQPNDKNKNGLYYHVSFYDLQAANHITALSNPPEMIGRELSEALRLKADDYWIVNCSNVKPHVYYLSMIAQLWKTGAIDPETWQQNYIEQYYGESISDAVSACFDSYFRSAVRYGPHADDAAGDQFFNYAVRILASQYMKADAPAGSLRWFADADTLRKQTERVLAVCKQADRQFAAHAALCGQTMQPLQGSIRERFEASLLLQAHILHGCARASVLACQSLLAAMDGDDRNAFYLAGKSRKAFAETNAFMRASERGKWQGFYENDCLTDVKCSAWVMGALMAFLRSRGDGPHFFHWQRGCLYAPGEARVLLITNMENHLDNDALFALMERTDNGANA